VATNPAKNATFYAIFAPEEGDCCISCNNLGEIGFKSGNIARNVAQSVGLLINHKMVEKRLLKKW